MSSNDPTTPRDRPDREAAGRPFDEALRAWAARPPETPPEEAARRLLGRLPRRRAGASPSRTVAWLAAACLVATLGATLFVLDRGPEPERPPAGEAPAAAPVPVAPPGDVLVIELDPETTLYMNLGTGREPGPTHRPGDPS